MIASYEKTKRFIGKPVCIEWEGKAYCGIVRDVTEKGVWLDPINITQLLHQTTTPEIKTADRPENMKLELSQFGFGFRPFFPFFNPFFFSPFFFSPFFFRRRFFI